MDVWRIKKRAAVMMTLKARASLRVSKQECRGVVGKNWKESGKTEGKPIEVNPFFVSGR